MFDFGEHKGSYFIAMEYVDGLDLRTLSQRARARGSPIPIAVCARLVSLACEGLAYAHELTDPVTGKPLNLVHRDISPDNLILSRAGLLKVLDFGVAKAIGGTTLTGPGVLKGKLAYMAPEVLQHQPADRRVDVYALGVVLYELLTGKKPFDATGDLQLVRAIMKQPVVPIGERRADVPAGLQRIVEKALSKRREERHQSCRELQTELERFISRSGSQLMPRHLAELVARLDVPAHLALRPSVLKPPSPSVLPETVDEKTILENVPPLMPEARTPAPSRKPTLPPAPAPSAARPGKRPRAASHQGAEPVEVPTAEERATARRGRVGQHRAHRGRTERSPRSNPFSN
jgi:serine/threonine-protein kinase